MELLGLFQHRCQLFVIVLTSPYSIGPVDLTTGQASSLPKIPSLLNFPMLGTVSGTPSVPTVTDNLLSQGIIQTETIGISYVPSTSASNVANGELTFGGTDSTKYVCLLDSDIFFLMKR